MNNQQPEGNLSSEIVHDEYQIVTLKAAETIDDFIFQRIDPFCEEVFQMKLNKNLLIRALTEYFQNHPESRERQ